MKVYFSSIQHLRDWLFVDRRLAFYRYVSFTASPRSRHEARKIAEI